MTKRAETLAPATYAGLQTALFVSQGYYDDYLELELPQQAALLADVATRLAQLPREVAGGEIDVRLREGEPPTLGLLVDYAGREEARRRGPAERLRLILSQVRRALPDLKAGDLLCGEDLAALPAQNDVAIAAPPPLTGPLATTEPSTPARGGVAHNRVGMAWTYLERARRLAGRGQLHKALRATDESLRQEPGHPAALALRQELRLLEQRAKRARRAPRDAQAQLEVGYSHLSLRNLDEAILALRRSRQLAPGLYLASLLLGVALHQRGRGDEARLAYEQALLLNGKESTARSLLAALNHGEPPPLLAEEDARARRTAVRLSA
ncbi:MAG: hypothetical protein ACYC4L_13430 [Chloroflexota bacterium]